MIILLFFSLLVFPALFPYITKTAQIFAGMQAVQLVNLITMQYNISRAEYTQK